MEGSGVSGGVAGKFEQDVTSTLRARFGYALGGAVLLCTRAGGAVACNTLALTAPGASASASRSHLNFVVGARVEGKLAQSISARIEVPHHEFGSQSHAYPGTNLNVDPSHTVVRAGPSCHRN